MGTMIACGRQINFAILPFNQKLLVRQKYYLPTKSMAKRL